MKAKIFSVLMIAAIALPSCDKWLEVDSVSEISNANYWKSESDVEGVVNGIYNLYRDLTNTTTYTEERSDELTSGQVGIPTGSVWTNTITPSMGYSWLAHYKILHHANLVINKTPAISFASETKKNTMLAQAHWFRARIYLMLIQSWGNTPIVLDPTESADQPKPARSAPLTVMDEVILPDIETAVSLFSDATISDRNRLSKFSAYCLKAEALAWRYSVLGGTAQNLRDGIAAIAEVDKPAIAEMLPGDEYAKVFSATNKKNREIIFSLYLENLEYRGMYAGHIAPDVAIMGSGITNLASIPYSDNLAARHEYAPSNALITWLTKYANDKRRAVSYTILTNAGGPVVVDAAATPVKYFVSQNKFYGTTTTGHRIFDDDIIIYRLSDMLLLKAEMQANLGGAEVANAIVTLNRVRDRAGIGTYPGATDQLTVQKEVLEERGRELCFELKRWPDLLRAHYLDVIDVYTAVPNLAGKTTPLYLPITTDMMALNPNLVQTTGYTN